MRLCYNNIVLKDVSIFKLYLNVLKFAFGFTRLHYFNIALKAIKKRFHLWKISPRTHQQIQHKFHQKKLPQINLHQASNLPANKLF